MSIAGVSSFSESKAEGYLQELGNIPDVGRSCNLCRRLHHLREVLGVSAWYLVRSRWSFSRYTVRRLLSASSHEGFRWYSANIPKYGSAGSMMCEWMDELDTQAPRWMAAVKADSGSFSCCITL